MSAAHSTITLGQSSGKEKQEARKEMLLPVREPRVGRENRGAQRQRCSLLSASMFTLQSPRRKRFCCTPGHICSGHGNHRCPMRLSHPEQPLVSKGAARWELHKCRRRGTQWHCLGQVQPCYRAEMSQPPRQWCRS